MVTRVLSLLVGVWLFLAPWVLRLGEPQARWNDWVVGLLVVLASAYALLRDRVRAADLALGTWLVLAPFVLGHREFAAVVNDVVVGLVIFFFSLVPARGAPAIRSGWLSRGEPGAA